MYEGCLYFLFLQLDIEAIIFAIQNGSSINPKTVWLQFFYAQSTKPLFLCVIDSLQISHPSVTLSRLRIYFHINPLIFSGYQDLMCIHQHL